ncbi:SpaA isopeptide-forming pilin-related protein [Ligilactobacillus sp. LYQ60]|uniref:SpaA isopeptide-forming pilin-related protein n=1 Tax=Ligilactobacillus sp. LYQ60 TaxID=3378799 RepID=UPI0038521D35
MKRFRKIGALFAAVILCLATFVTTWGGAKASSVSVGGLGAANATVYDASGKDVTGQTTLSRYQAYTVKYHGSIADSAQINDGDTTTFTLPDNVQVANAQNCNIYDQNGNVAGTATIAAGAKTGTITFNNDLHGKLNRSITLSVGVVGTTTETTNNSNAPSPSTVANGSDTNPATLAAAINKVGWFDKDDSSIIHWDVVANLHNADLKDPVITDNMGPGMELVPGSVKVQEGYYDNGTFTGAISAPNAKVTTNGSQITINVPSTNLAIHVSYEAKITSKSETNYKNNATISAANLSQTGTDSAMLPGELRGNVVFDEGELTVQKVDATTKKPLAGAKFALFTKDHQIIDEETTGADGLAHFTKLDSGDYLVKEVTAPSGYTINNKLYPVNISDTTKSGTVTVTDTPDNSAQSSSSSSAKAEKASSSSVSGHFSNKKVSSSAQTFAPVKSAHSSASSVASSANAKAHTGRVIAKQPAKQSSKQASWLKQLPDTGDMIAGGLVVIGVIVLAGAGFLLLRKRH